MKPIPVRHLADSPKGPGTAARFSIRELQQVLNGKDLIHDLHKHDFYFVLAVQKGRGVHEIDFSSYDVRDHSLFILRPGQVHRLEIKAGARGYLLEFDLSFYQPKHHLTEHRWQKATRKNFCEVEAARFRKLHSLLSGIYREFTERQEGYREAIKAGLDLFFIEYLRQSRDPQSLAGPESGYTQERFEELVQLLETKIRSLKNVSQYARLLHLSPYQLNSITRASVGKTVSALLHEQIVLEAKRCLLAGNDPVKDIADHLGYEDVSYFIRFFKKQTGYSPEAFRKNFR